MGLLSATRVGMVKAASGENAVLRTELLGRMDRSSGVVLLQAPAGHGKTTLMQQMRLALMQEGVATDWITLDESDNDASRLLARLQAVLGRLEGQAPLAADTPGETPSVTAGQALRSDWFIHRVARLGAHVAVFLDEFQVIHNRSILGFFRGLLERLPVNATIVIGSRTVPDIGMARLSVNGLATVLRAQDLRFSLSEAETFFSLLDGTDLTREELVSIYERSEGWPAALQLYRLSLGSQTVRKSLSDITAFRPRELADYLAENVIDLQPGPIQRFLRETALLKRVCAPVCMAVTGRKDAQKVLCQLERAGLFLRSLDSEEYWFKYHTLFSDFLARQLLELDPDRAFAVHREAARWFAAHQHYDAAMHHATTAGEVVLAAGILDEWAGRLIMDGDLTTVEHWFDSLPLTVVEERPSLVVKIAYALAFLRRRRKLEPVQAILERYSDSGDAELAARTAVVCSMILIIQDDIPGACKAVRTVDLHQDPRDSFHAFELGAGANLEGFLAIAAGNPERAHDYLALGRARSERADAAFSWGYAVSTLGVNLLLQGFLPEALEKLRQGMLDPRISLDESAASAVLVASYIYALYEADDFDAAVTHFEQYRGVIRNAALLDYMTLSYVALARIHDARGDAVKAQEYLDELEEVAYASSWPRMLRNINWERVRRALARGEIDRANSLASRIPEQGTLEVPRWIPFSEDTEGDCMGRLRLAIANRDYQQALMLVRRHVPEASRLRRVRREIKLRTLEALALKSTGDNPAAQRALARALQLAAPGGFIRIFLEEGPAVLGLLRELGETMRQSAANARETTSPETGRAAYDHLHRVLKASGIEVASAAALEGERFEPLEPLTEREVQILALVADGASNRAIASKLFVSENTVKFHLKNIYSKLAVTGRAQAIHAAHQMGMI